MLLNDADMCRNQVVYLVDDHAGQAKCTIKICKNENMSSVINFISGTHNF